LAAGVIFLVSLIKEIDLALAGAAALVDLLGSGAAFLTDSFLAEGFLEGDYFLGDEER